MVNFLKLADRSVMVHKARTCCYRINSKTINNYRIIFEGFYAELLKERIGFLKSC